MHRYICVDCKKRRRASDVNRFRCRRCLNAMDYKPGEGNRPNGKAKR